MENLDNVDCPICGRKMTRGYIYSSREIAWTEDGKGRLIPGIYHHETLINSLGFKVEKMPACRCDDCGIVIFEYYRVN